MEPVVIFAVLAILFALLNVILWSFLWKYCSADNDKQNNSPNEINSKVEDQLWGVIDKIKELERGIGSIEEKISETAAAEAEKYKTINQLGTLNKKTATLVQANSKWLGEIIDSIQNLTRNYEEVEELKKNFKSVQDNLDRLNSTIDKLHQ